MTASPEQPKSVVTLPKNNEVEFTPFGSQDKIKLSVSIIQKFVAIPTKTGKLPDEREAIRFMMLCRSRHLNPFEGDCYLMGYEGRDGITWSLITAHQAFLKRAEVHPEFDGFESGVIVREGQDGDIKDRKGDFLLPDDILLGGWCIVYFKARKHPMERRLNLSTFKKPFGRWNDDPAGMIVKCAEADALRSSFPTLLGGFYSDIERPVIDVASTSAKAPDFGPETRSAKPAPSEAVRPQPMRETQPSGPGNGQAGQDKSVPEQSGQPNEAGDAENPHPSEAPASPSNSGETDNLKSLRFQMQKAGVTEPQVMEYARQKSIARADQKKLGELSDAKIGTINKAFQNMLPEIRSIAV